MERRRIEARCLDEDERTLPRSDNVRNDVSIIDNIAGNIPKGYG